MSDEDLEVSDAELIAVTALRVEALERQVSMLGAAVGVLQAHMQDPALNATIERAMLAAKFVQEQRQRDQEPDEG